MLGLRVPGARAAVRKKRYSCRLSTATKPAFVTWSFGSAGVRGYVVGGCKPHPVPMRGDNRGRCDEEKLRTGARSG